MATHSAVAAWQQQMRAHHEQSVRAQQAGGWDGQAAMGAMAPLFAADPKRTDDLSLNRLRQVIAPGSSVLDVGGGAGRYAIPLVMDGCRVTVVEPLGAMTALLRSTAAELGVADIEIVEARWEDAVVPPAQTVLGANVVNGIVEIRPFLEKLTESAHEQVILLLWTILPITYVAPLWEHVHGERRILPPGLRDLQAVLREIGILADVEMLPPEPPLVLPSREAAAGMARALLFLNAGSEQDAKLQATLDALLEDTTGGVAIRGAGPRGQAMLTWAGAARRAS